MAIITWVLLVTFILLLIVGGIWVFYNFYWLNRAQVYLVYNPRNFARSNSLLFNQKDVDDLTSKFGGTLASLSDLNDPGSNVCQSGYVNDKSGKGYNIVWSDQPTTPCTTNGAGQTCNNGCVKCGCNKQVNSGYFSAGYWLYGPKPAVSSEFDDWVIAPWSDKLYNKYEIWGVGKFL